MTRLNDGGVFSRFVTLYRPCNFVYSAQASALYAASCSHRRKLALRFSQDIVEANAQLSSEALAILIVALLSLRKRYKTL